MTVTNQPAKPANANATDDLGEPTPVNRVFESLSSVTRIAPVVTSQEFTTYDFNRGAHSAKVLRHEIGGQEAFRTNRPENLPPLENEIDEIFNQLSIEVTVLDEMRDKVDGAQGLGAMGYIRRELQALGLAPRNSALIRAQHELGEEMAPELVAHDFQELNRVAREVVAPNIAQKLEVLGIIPSESAGFRQASEGLLYESNSAEFNGNLQDEIVSFAE